MERGCTGFLMGGLWIVFKTFRDILQSFEKFYRMSKNSVAVRPGAGRGVTPPAFENFDWIFSHFRVCFLPFRGLLPKVDKIIFSHFGAKVTGKSSWKPEKPRWRAKKKGLQLVTRLKIWAEDRKFSEKSDGHPMEQTFSAFLPFDWSPPAFTPSRRHWKKFLENFQNFLKKLLKTHENFEKILITPEKLSKILKNFQKVLKKPLENFQKYFNILKFFQEILQKFSTPPPPFFGPGDTPVVFAW